MVVSRLVQTPIAMALGLTWQALLDPSFGIGSTPGLHWLAKPLLGSPELALYTVIFVIAWQFLPLHALLYQAGIRQIPTALYEAAALDGTGPVTQSGFTRMDSRQEGR
ncbi:hypothetical protein [Streptomyces prunicolor]|uniref:ABC transmembrane type-1 domain-containing protein n=1 Tax=Streptomyces prunicolor TaxID=67348 RepID=A0ABU4F5X2_9ACTN|nr:hypothetical protein [Streptomyces prunicolor]MDV7215992.1 hypothetical protein [Streptomyces prunicolor]